MYITHLDRHAKKSATFQPWHLWNYGQKSGPATRYRCRHSVSNSAPCPRIPHILRGVLMMGMFGGDVFFLDFLGFLDGGGEWKRWENKRQDFPPLKWWMCRMSRSLMIVVQQNCTSCNFELKKPWANGNWHFQSRSSATKTGGLPLFCPHKKHSCKT